MKMTARLFLGITFLAAQPPPSECGDGRATLFPNVHAGQTLTYLIQFKSQKETKTQSNVAAPLAPSSPDTDVHGLLRIEILQAIPQNQRTEIHARAHFQNMEAGTSSQTGPGKGAAESLPNNNPDKAAIRFTIHANGMVDQIEGLDGLAPDQQQIWREWASKFAIAGTFLKSGVKLGEKWESQAEEKSSSPIAGLSWAKNWQYVRDEPCHAAQLSAAGAAATPAEPPESEQCAVILSSAKLRQKSSPKNSTPEEFRLHELRTMGVAKGENEVIAYISLRTGLVIRATEEAHQFMDVIIAKADDTNQVHYNIEAQSHSEVRLVTEITETRP